MVVTKEGQTPPEIGVLFPEDDKERNKRRGGSGLGDWNTVDTYSFSFNSMYVDLPAWKLVSLPMMRDMDLKTFWGTAGLRLVVYENESSRKMKHKKEENKYVLCIETKFREEGETEPALQDGENPNSDGRGGSMEDSLPWGRVMKKRVRVCEERSDMVDTSVRNPSLLPIYTPLFTTRTNDLSIATRYARRRFRGSRASASSPCSITTTRTSGRPTTPTRGTRTTTMMSLTRVSSTPSRRCRACP